MGADHRLASVSQRGEHEAMEDVRAPAGPDLQTPAGEGEGLASVGAALVEAALEPITVFTPIRDEGGSLVDLEFFDANPAACAYNGIPREELIGRRLLDLFPAMADSPSMGSYHHVLDTGETVMLLAQAYPSELHSGHERLYDIRIGRIGDRLYSAWLDVTQRAAALRNAEVSNRVLEAAEQLAHLGSWVWDLTSGRIWWSDEHYRIFGLTPQQPLPGTEGYPQFVHPGDRDHVTELLNATQTTREPYWAEHRIVRPDGEVRWVRAQGTFLPAADGAPDRILGVVLDITEQRRYEDEISRLAVTDPLTGVWNRRHGQQTLATHIAEGHRYRTPLSLLMLDIDHFKSINDTHGHQVGDLVLIDLCRHLAENLRPSDLLVRWGGEEFVILARHCDLASGVALAEKLHALIGSTAFSEAGTVTVSIGVTELRPDDTLDSWLDRADRALYAAKAAGRNTVRSTR